MGTTVERHTHLDLKEGVACLIGERHAIANVTYAKVMGALFIIIGLVGMPFVGQTVLGIGFSSAHNVFHIMAGVVWVLAVMIFDGTYARMANQVIGIAFLAMGAFGLSQAAPLVHQLFNLTPTSSVLSLVIGLVTVGFGWGVNQSHLKHWWP